MSALTAPLLGARFDAGSSRVLLENNLLLSADSDTALNFVFQGVGRTLPAGPTFEFTHVANSTATFLPAYPGVPPSVSANRAHPVPSMFSFAVAPMRGAARTPLWPARLTVSMFSAPSASDDLTPIPAKLALHGLFRETMKRVPLTRSWLAVLRPYADCYGGKVPWGFVLDHAELRFSGVSLQAWSARVLDFLNQHKSMHDVFESPLPAGHGCAVASVRAAVQGDVGDVCCTVSDPDDLAAQSAAALIRGASAHACTCVSFDVVMRPVVPVVGVDAWGGYSAATAELERCQFTKKPRDLITVPRMRLSHTEDGSLTWSFEQPWAVKSMFNVTWTAVEAPPLSSDPPGWKVLL